MPRGTLALLAVTIGSTPQALAEHLNNKLVGWSALIKERDIRLD